MYENNINFFYSSRNFRDFYRLAEWCKINAILLNIKKHKLLSFMRGSWKYNLNGETLESVLSFDLSVVFDGKLMFELHVKSAACRAKSLLDFIEKWLEYFDGPYVTKRFVDLYIYIWDH